MWSFIKWTIPILYNMSILKERTILAVLCFCGISLIDTCSKVVFDDISDSGIIVDTVDTNRIGVVSSVDSISSENVMLLSYKKINGDYITNKINRSGQGMAIKDGYLYRLYDTGICQVIDISKIDSPKFMFSFELGSCMSNNHCNCAQFDNRRDSTILYISSVKSLNGERGKCFVEKIEDQHSILIQTISVEGISTLKKYKGVNIICGDDGYLWIFGYDIDGKSIIYAKARRPAIKEGKYITLNDNDLLDYWYDSEYSYANSVSQGGVIHKGRLYFVFGTTSTNRHIVVYDIKSHEKIGDINLNDIVKEEPEDIDFCGESMVLSIVKGGAYYILDFKNV